MLYGLACVVLTLFTGWLGGVLFKRLARFAVPRAVIASTIRAFVQYAKVCSNRRQLRDAAQTGAAFAQHQRVTPRENLLASAFEIPK